MAVMTWSAEHGAAAAGGPRRRYGAPERRAAVHRAFGTGTTTRGAGADVVARELGVSVSTLYRWARGLGGQSTAPEPDTAERLVSACQSLLRERTFTELTLEEVADRAGVALRTVFYRYPTKEALVAAATAAAAADVRAVIIDRLDVDAVETEPLRVVTEALVAGLHAAAALPRSDLLFRDLGIPPGDDTARQWHDALADEVAPLLGRAAALGQLPPGDPRVRARIVVAAARAINALRLDGVPLAELERATRRAVELLR